MKAKKKMKRRKLKKWKEFVSSISSDQAFIKKDTKCTSLDEFRRRLKKPKAKVKRNEQTKTN